MSLMEPKEVSVPDLDGNQKVFVIHKVPATLGREIMAKYPVSNMPKLGEYQSSEEIMLKMMGHCAVRLADGTLLTLDTMSTINNHVTDGHQLIQLEYAMLQYNTAFFRIGKHQGFIESLVARVLPKIIETLTPFLQQLSQQAKPAGQNSKPQSRSKKPSTSGK